MLSISKIGASGGGAYVAYLTGEAARDAGTRHIAHDDGAALASYYEVDGGARWFGSLSPEPGGTLDPAAFQAMLDGVDPETGEALATIDGQRTVVAYDLVMSAPKSVSLLGELGDDATRQTVQSAHDEAVATALQELEQWAVYLRRGEAGREIFAGEGLIGVSVDHHTSRADDPQLHTHNVISSLSVDEDGLWSSIDGQALYALAALGGSIYQQQLRHRLTAELGVRWTQTEKGMAELAGVPDEVLQRFSKRRTEILEQVDVDASRASRQVAAYDTRADKAGVSIEELRGRWERELAVVAELAPRELLQRAQTAEIDQPDPARWAQTADQLLVGPDGLTAHRASFDARQAARSLFDLAPADVDAREVLDEAREFIGRQLRLEDQRPRAASSWMFRRHTTQDMARVEERLWTTAQRMTAPGRVAPAADVETMKAAAAAAGLQTEQAELLREAVTTGRGLVNAVGVAGAGKTYTMEVASQLWRAAGRRTIATSTAARVAVDLAEDAGFSHGASLTALLGELDRGDRTLAPNDVIVVDEAGMVETRMFDRLLAAADAAGAQVVAVGDWSGQLQAIGAGGAQRDMADLPGTVQLTQTVRAEEQWERDAQLGWRAGGAAADQALDTYIEQGRIELVEDRDDARQQLLDAWWGDLHPDDTEELPDPTQSLMIAGRRADVHALNDRAREQRIIAGEVNPAVSVEAAVMVDDDPTGEIEHRFDVAAGDRVVLRRNDHDLGILNGHRGRVETVHRDGGVTVRVDGGSTARLPADYLATGGLRLGYAVTAHAAQGMTVDRTHVLADQMLTRQWGYSAMTRGRASNQMTFVADRFDERDHDLQLRDAWLETDIQRTARSIARDEVSAPDIEQARSHAAAAGLDLDDDQLLEAATDRRLRREHDRAAERQGQRNLELVRERDEPAA